MNLTISALSRSYKGGNLTPASLVEQLLKTIASAENPAVWIVPPDRDALLVRTQELEAVEPESLPLYGIPFVVKDNIDVAGIPTTAACPDFSYTPERSAPVVQRLIDAGAIFLGKTNLDQFATGLVGVRSPYGIPRNPFNSEFIPGGSSSGSAVAVASEFCSFSLGTDTAGSGRIPASLNNLVGLKPTKGLLSTIGVVPACRSLDCVSIFALNPEDASALLDITAAFDLDDPFSRKTQKPKTTNGPVRVGIPAKGDLSFFGDGETEALYYDSVERVRGLGLEVLEIDFQPFLKAARLLYEGPWVSERFVAIESFLKSHPDSIHPITRQIIEGGATPSAADLFKAEYKLQALQREADAVWNQVDTILTPTAGKHYTIAEVEADPILLNSNLGTYTNFMNLLDCAAVAIPAGFLQNAMPWGVTLFAPAFSDSLLLSLADGFLKGNYAPSPAEGNIQVAVCGAHLNGQPLNFQLTDRGATLVQSTTTSPNYRFYALPPIPEKGIPPRPALIHATEGGAAIDVEVWSLAPEAFGTFVAGIPAPLGIGKVTLADGSQVPGFIAEPRATHGAEEITALGSWRTFVQR